MRVRSKVRTAGFVAVGFAAGLVGVSATVDSPMLDRALDRLEGFLPQLDGVNPVPVGLLIAGPTAGFFLARRRNRRLAR